MCGSLVPHSSTSSTLPAPFPPCPAFPSDVARMHVLLTAAEHDRALPSLRHGESACTACCRHGVPRCPLCRWPLTRAGRVLPAAAPVPQWCSCVPAELRAAFGGEWPCTILARTAGAPGLIKQVVARLATEESATTEGALMGSWALVDDNVTLSPAPGKLPAHPSQPPLVSANEAS